MTGVMPTAGLLFDRDPFAPNTFFSDGQTTFCSPLLVSKTAPRALPFPPLLKRIPLLRTLLLVFQFFRMWGVSKRVSHSQRPFPPPFFSPHTPRHFLLEEASRSLKNSAEARLPKRQGFSFLSRPLGLSFSFELLKNAMYISLLFFGEDRTFHFPFDDK